jgi:hypothetical protein
LVRANARQGDRDHRRGQHHHPAGDAKWALLAPIFIPLFLRLGT